MGEIAQVGVKKNQTRGARHDGNTAIIEAAASSHVALGNVLVTGPQLDREAMLDALDKIVVSSANKATSGQVTLEIGGFRQFLEQKNGRNPRVSDLLRKRGHEIRDLGGNRTPREHVLDPLKAEVEEWLTNRGVRKFDSTRLAQQLTYRFGRLKLVKHGATNTVKLAV